MNTVTRLSLPQSLPDRFYAARRRRSGYVVVEGFHGLKHALRFGAVPHTVVTPDLVGLTQRFYDEAGDVADRFAAIAAEVDRETFQRLAPTPPETGVLAIVPRPAIDALHLLSSNRRAPVVILESPSHMGNIGATVRVAAAAGAAGVIVLGDHDPWHPAAVRGGAGLQFALPVAAMNPDAFFTHVITGPPTPGLRTGPLIGVHPEGAELGPGSVPDDSLLVFGSESRGLTGKMLAHLDDRRAIAMEPGVSSLNLATAVAVALYTWRLSGKARHARHVE